MFKSRFFLIVAVLSLTQVTLAVSQPLLSEPREMRNLDAYHQSERTRIPVCFNPYQLSSWFGQ